MADPRGPYRDGQALWRAVTDRAKVVARETGVEHNAVVRRFVQQRFLARVFADSDRQWVLKGGTAVLTRVHDARTTKDVDLLNELGDIAAARAHLERAAARDLGDHFRFVPTGWAPLDGAASQPHVTGCAVHFDVYCGTGRKGGIKVDVVTGSLMTTDPEVRIDPVLPLPGVEPPEMRVYPLVDHIADKLCATQAMYGARGDIPSGRTRDLVDIIVLARSADIDGTELSTAIHAEWVHRRMPGSPAFSPPASWARTYPALARTVPACAGLTAFSDAVTWAVAFLNPAIDRTAIGRTWSARTEAWRAPSTPPSTAGT